MQCISYTNTHLANDYPVFHTITPYRLFYFFCKTKMSNHTEQTIRPGGDNNRVQNAEKRFVPRAFSMLWGASCIHIRVICQKKALALASAFFIKPTYAHDVWRALYSPNPKKIYPEVSL